MERLVVHYFVSELCYDPVCTMERKLGVQWFGATGKGVGQRQLGGRGTILPSRLCNR